MANPMKIAGTVTTVTRHTDDVFTLEITPEKKVPRFKAGQFLHFTIDDFDPYGGYWPESRVFSIASAPMSKTVEIVYSVKGRYTSRMSSEIVQGTPVWLKMPYGDFSIELSVEPEQNILLVAGGTGISPYISYLRTLLLSEEQLKRKVHLIYGIRNKNHLLFSDIIENCSKKIERFSSDLYIEDPTENMQLNNIEMNKGMISLTKILERYRQLSQTIIFLSGPPVMITTFSAELEKAGIPKSSIRIDAWE